MKSISIHHTGRRPGHKITGGLLGVSAILGLAFSSLTINGCSEDPPVRPEVPTTTPDGAGGVVIPAGVLPLPSQDGTIELPGGGQIHLVDVGGTRFMPIEGTFVEASYRAVRGRAADATSRDVWSPLPCYRREEQACASALSSAMSPTPSLP